MAKREDGFQERSLAAFINHPSYDPNIVQFDVAMLNMNEPFIFTETVKVI